MVALRLAGVAFPIAVALLLLGVLRMALSRWFGGDPYVGGFTAVAQALAGVWLAVIIGLLVARRLTVNDRERVDSPAPAPNRGSRTLTRRKLTRRENRVFWLLFPSIMAITHLVEARLTGQLTIAVVAAAVTVAAVFTLVLAGGLKLVDRRVASR